MIVYIVNKNSDMTEGRGPKVLVTVDTDGQRAVDYAMSQKGIMGRAAPNPDWEVIAIEEGSFEKKLIYPHWKQITPTTGRYTAHL